MWGPHPTEAAFLLKWTQLAKSQRKNRLQPKEIYNIHLSRFPVSVYTNFSVQLIMAWRVYAAHVRMWTSMCDSDSFLFIEAQGMSVSFPWKRGEKVDAGISWHDPESGPTERETVKQWRRERTTRKEKTKRYENVSSGSIGDEIHW